MMSRRKSQPLHGEGVLEPLTKSVATEAREQNIRAAVAGGYAMRFYGSSRLTADVDFIAEQKLREEAPGWEYEKALSFGGQSYVVDGLPVDWIVRDDEYGPLYSEALHYADSTDDGYLIVTPEYLAAMKFATRRRKDELDVLFLLQVPDLVDRKVLEVIVYRLVGGRFAVDELWSLFREADWGGR